MTAAPSSTTGAASTGSRLSGRNRPLRILFAFENVLPSREADAEVFTSTAKALAAALDGAALHLPTEGLDPPALGPDLRLVPAWAPSRPAALRHSCCGLTIAFRQAFRDADLVYTRNLWVATVAVLFGRTVVFDHYRPWPDQIPPALPALRLLMRHRRLRLNICHSDYTRNAYRRIGIPDRKLATVRNGFEPARLRDLPSRDEARRALDLPSDRSIVVYTGRVNGRKGLDVVVRAASRLPDVLFLLVGADGSEPAAFRDRAPPNVRLVGWQTADGLVRYLAAADALVIPPSRRPLAEHGSTVLPLKVFLYMASGRPIVAGRTADLEEVLRDGENALLCSPDEPDALAASLERLLADPELGRRLAAAAKTDSADLTWDARARRILLLLATVPAAGTDAAGTTPPPFDRSVWLRDCGRWLRHLVRTRSIVLPPRSTTSAERGGGDQDAATAEVS